MPRALLPLRHLSTRGPSTHGWPPARIANRGYAMTEGSRESAAAADDLAYPAKLAARERELLARRRSKAGVKPEAAVLGMAFSGGGIRSATFCLGFTQALARARELRQVDYLSTASGGGYFGGFLGRLYARDYVAGPDKVEAMLDPELPPCEAGVGPGDPAWRPNAFRWLRENGRYLAPNGAGDLLLALAVALRNWAAMHLLLASGVLALLLLLQIPVLCLPADGPVAAALPGSERLLWWSPLAELLPWVFNFGLLPLGWAYWLIDAREDEKTKQAVPGLIDRRQPAVAALLILSFMLAGYSGAGFDLLFVTALTTLIALRASSAYRSAIPRERADKARDLLSRWLGKALLGFGLLLALVLIDTLGRTWYALLTHTPTGLGTWFIAIGVAIMAVVTRASSLIELLSKLTGHDAGSGQRVPVQLLTLIAALVLGTGALSLVDLAAQAFVWGFEAPAGVPATLVGAGAGGRLAGSGVHVGVLLTGILGATAISWALGSRDSLGFLNRTSLDPLYSARLTRAYLGASNPRRHDGRTFEAVTEVAPGDDIGLDDYHRRGIYRGAPLHLINVTINETVDGKSQIQQQDRHGLTLALGPAGLSAGVRHHALFVPKNEDDRDDFEETAAGQHDRPQVLVFGPWVHDDEDGERLPVFAWAKPPAGIPPVCEGARLYTAEPLTLGHWLGISGAAFSTGRGQGTSFGVSLLSGFFNTRLGRWWDSGVLRQKTWRDLPSRLFGAHALLLREFLARFPGTARQHWFVSDGGHFENLALYELIRRRLPWILAIDAGCDRDFTFEDLGNFVRKARLDFGAEVRFLDADQIRDTGFARYRIGPLEALRIDRSAADASAPACAALASIQYADKSCGVLLYVKATLCGDLPTDVREYASGHPAFPHEPTSDQFFDEAQWESYRRLGEHIGHTLFNLVPTEPVDSGTGRPSRLRRLFEELHPKAVAC